MKRIGVCLALLVPLALASSASAKEVVSAKVCGSSGCRTTEERESLLALQEGGGPTDPPAGAAGFYRAWLAVAVERGRRETFPIAIVPSRGLIRAGNETDGYSWMSVSTEAAREMREMTAGLDPFPHAKLEGARADLPEARVDEVVLPPADPQPADGGASAWPWIAAGFAAAAFVALGIRRMRRRGPGLPKPAEG